MSDSCNQDDYENDLSKALNNPNKIDIFKSPVKKHIRKRSQSEKKLNYEFDTGNFIFMEKSFSPRKNGASNKGRRRGYSQKNVRYNNIIISDIDAKDEVSNGHQVYNNKYIQRTPTYKSIKSFYHENSLKKKKYRKKKVNFRNKFVDIIEVESYKKYNINDGLYDNANAKCTCSIY